MGCLLEKIIGGINLVRIIRILYRYYFRGQHGNTPATNDYGIAFRTFLSE